MAAYRDLPQATLLGLAAKDLAGSLPQIGSLVLAPDLLAPLLARHGTRGQATFFLASRDRSIEDVAARDQAVRDAITAVTPAIPADWRRGVIERADLPRFLFEPGTSSSRWARTAWWPTWPSISTGRSSSGSTPSRRATPASSSRTPPGPRPACWPPPPARQRPAGPLSMVQALTDDGQRLAALNEIYIGQATHQTARYTLTLPGGRAEPQASSGLIVSTGTGATGWCRSAWLERRSTLTLSAPAEPRLAWFVREAWPSPATGTACTEGDLAAGQALTLTAESDHLVVFGDGIESDTISLSWGQSARIRLAAQTLRLLR